MKWPLLLFLLFPILLDSSSFAQSPKETPEQYKARICSDAAYDDTGLLKQECERMGGQLSPPAKQEIAPSGDAGSKSDQKKQQDQFGMSDSDYLKAFVIAILLGLIPAFIARNRGHSFTFWWIFGALALVVALPWSLFLKDRESEIKGANKESPAEPERPKRPAPTVGIIAAGLGLASVTVPYFAAVFFVPATLICAVIALIRRQTGWGIAGLALGLLGLVGIVDTSRQITALFNGEGGRLSLPQPAFAPPPIVTRQKYDQIQNGMSYRQVRNIIGSNGEELSRSNIAGMSADVYSWTNSNGSSMQAIFQNGRLVSKSQFGLP